MDTEFLCIPCLVRQGIDAFSRMFQEQRDREQALRMVLKTIGDCELSSAPPVIAARVQEAITGLGGEGDPYAEEKLLANKLALEVYDDLVARVARAGDPFEASCRVAVAANIIDLGVKSQVSRGEILDSIEASFQQPLDLEAVNRLRCAASAARRILYLCDNAGEVVLDRLLIAALGPEKVTAVVKAGPILNDAAMEDAITSGLSSMVRVITNGTTIPGTVLSRCSEEFLQHFSEADMIVSKGQGNFETLAGTEGPLFYLLKVKCERISRHTGYPLGSILILTPGQALPRV